MPERIQMSRQKPWRADNPTAVKIDRSTPYGNPYRVAPCVDRWRGWRVVSNLSGDAVGPIWPTKPAALKDALRRFRHWAMKHWDLFEPLRGSDVACWCALDDDCHGDFILEMVNGGVA